MSSEEVDYSSDDSLFTSVTGHDHETVATLPLKNVPESPRIEYDDGDTLATLPAYPRNGTQNTSRNTQHTQLVELPDNASSPPPADVVQVAASSPSRPTAPALASAARKPSGILASAMAPAGTAFRKPLAPRPPPRPISNNDDGPMYIGDSTDEDQSGSRNIKHSTFTRGSAEKVPDSPQAGSISTFKSQLAGFGYNASIKRSADTMANAYGNASKRPKQTAPSRVVPIDENSEGDMELNDISEAMLRIKVKRLNTIFPNNSVRECFEALQLRKHFDDATDYLLLMSEKKRVAKSKTVDLTGGSDDELMPTPAMKKKQQPPVQEMKQQARKPAKTILEKYSTQGNKPVNKHLSVFDTPKGEPQKKGRTLVRGSRTRSSSPIAKPEPAHVVLDESESDTADSGIHSEPEDLTFQTRLLKFFNECTVADLMDTAAVTREIADHMVTKRPFPSLKAVSNVQDPSLKPGKRKPKIAVGERILNKVEEMLESYDAVDFLVSKCEKLAAPLTREMKSWGINIQGKPDGELDLVALTGSQRSHPDSGIGTPVSDDDKDVEGLGKRLLGQPSIMAEGIQMKDYQIVGINWLSLLYKRRLSCILADDMGLGKTLQVIAFFAHLLEIGETGPHLVVVPAATLENWLKEFQRFCPTIKVEPYYSTSPPERFEMRESIEERREEINVLVTTYTLAKAKEDSIWLKNFGFTCTVYDEGHALKNAASQLSQKLSKIKSDFRLLLTGTPLQNNLRELISLLGFIMPKLFLEKSEELEAIFTHSVKTIGGNHDALLSAERIARARGMLTPFILRRKKYQVLKDLPKKERRVEYCDMTPEQQEIYSHWLGKARDIALRRAQGEDVSGETTNILMKLRQAAIHPFLFRRLYPDSILPKIAKQCLRVDQWSLSNPDLIVTELTHYSDMEIRQLCDKHPELNKFALKNKEWLASGKIQKMLELLHKFMSEGHRTLIFSQFVMVLDILEIVLQRESVQYFRLDGNTKVSERQDLIDEFCEDSNTTPVFMLSTKAGGAGINLAKANRVIVFDSGFNPQDDVQAENRAHRIGQTKEVEVVRLVSKGTVEEQIYAMGLTKLKLDEEVAGVGEEALDEPKKDGVETKKETEGRKLVEDMMFKALEQDVGVKSEVSVEDNSDSATEEADIKAEEDVKPVDEIADAAKDSMLEDDVKDIKPDPETSTNVEDGMPSVGLDESEEMPKLEKRMSVDLPSRPRGIRSSSRK